MNKSKPILAVAALVALAAGAIAQGKQMDAFDYHAANVRLLESKSVQKELGITEAVRGKLNKHAEAHQKRLVAYQDKNKDKQLNAPDQELLGIMEALKKDVLSELTPAQLKRLRELSLQTVGLVAILDDKVANKVGIDQALLKKLRETYVTGSKQANGLIQSEMNKVLASYKQAKPANDAEKKKLADDAKAKLLAAEKKLEPQVEKIRTDTRNQMLAMMSAQQKNAFLALQGKKLTASN